MSSVGGEVENYFYNYMVNTKYFLVLLKYRLLTSLSLANRFFCLGNVYQSYTHALSYYCTHCICSYSYCTCTEIDPQWTSYINPCESKHAYMTLTDPINQQL